MIKGSVHEENLTKYICNKQRTKIQEAKIERHEGRNRQFNSHSWRIFLVFTSTCKELESHHSHLIESSCYLCQKQNKKPHKNPWTRGFISGLSVLFYWSIFMPVLHCHDCCCFVLGFEIGNLSLPTFFFTPKIVLAILGPYQLHMNCKFSFSVSTKKSVGVLVGVALNLQINLGNFTTLAILTLTIQENGILFVCF